MEYGNSVWTTVVRENPLFLFPERTFFAELFFPNPIRGALFYLRVKNRSKHGDELRWRNW